MKIFISGPMRGYPEFNFPEFARVAERLRQDGHTVFSPAEHELSLGFDPTGCEGRLEEFEAQGFDLRRALRDELIWLLHDAEVVVTLPGWVDSRGARAEVAVADALGIPVWSVAEMEVGLLDEAND